MELSKIAMTPSDQSDPIFEQIETLRDRLGSALRLADQLTATQVAPVSHQPVTEQYVRGLIKSRRRRGRFFAQELFADPAWDILLSLYAAALGQFRVTVSQVCDGAAVPATTALRWIKLLEDQGLIVRRQDPMDGRRQFLMLSAQGLDAMNGYFRTVPVGTPLI